MRQLAIPLILTIVLGIWLTPSATSQELIIGVSGQDILPLAERIHELIARDPRLASVSVRTIRLPVLPTDILAQMATGTRIDVLLVPYQHARQLADADAITPLDGMLARHLQLGTLVHDVPVGVRSTTLWGGQSIGIPLYSTLRMVGYNLEHYASVGLAPPNDWYWDDFSEAGRRLNAMYPGQAVICSLPDCWLPFLWSNGGGYVDDGFQTVELRLPESRVAFEWLRETVKRGDLAVESGFTATGLARGTISMAPLESKDRWLSPPPGSPNVDLALTPFPRSHQTGESVTIVNSQVYVVNSAATQSVQLATFLELVLSRPVQDAVVQAGLLPATTSVQRYSIDGDPTTPVLLQALTAARPLPPPMVNNKSTWEPAVQMMSEYLAGNVTYDELVFHVESSLGQWAQ